MLIHEINVALPALRAEAEALMSDEFTAYAVTRQKVGGLDEDVETSQGVTRGRLSGRSRGGDTNTRTVEIGGVERPVIEGGLSIPVSAPLPAPGWVYVCTATGPSSDPALLNRRWRVVDVPAKSHATARRLDVVEVD